MKNCWGEAATPTHKQRQANNSFTKDKAYESFVVTFDNPRNSQSKNY